MSLRDKIYDAMWATGICGARRSEYRVLADAVMRALRPVEAGADSEPLILYFPTKEDREEFIAAVHEAEPGGNRSDWYRFGWLNGRDDRAGEPRQAVEATALELLALARREGIA